MKHIGIVNITTVGACICANEIVAEADRIGLSGNHPEFSIHAFPFSVYKECVIKKDWEGIARIILSSIEKLRMMGAEFIIIPSNTPHYAIDKIKQESPLPVLNLIDLVAEECLKKGYAKVAILGTKATMVGGLYNHYLSSKGIKTVIPTETGCDLINELIMDHIIPLKDDRNAFATKIADVIIKPIDCYAIILGCTELPDVYDAKNLGKPVIDTTRLLSQKALEFALRQELKQELHGGDSQKSAHHVTAKI